MDTISLKIKRQDGPNAKPYWEEFAIPYKENLNIISLLQMISLNPVNAKGEKVTPVVYESNCLEEVCGACSMVINGHARQACSALVDQLKQPITLEPLSKFPIVRDLMVDRSALFEALTKVKAWVNIDGIYDMGFGPKDYEANQSLRYEFSRCMTCGCCAQSCPNYTLTGDFIGPAAVGQALLFNLHPTGSQLKGERYEALMAPGGLFECGNSQNCVRACPKEIPLTTSLAKMKQKVTWYAIKSIFIK